MSIQNLNQQDKLFYKGIECFNKQNFYDAHEYWEDLWSDYRLPDAKFIQGLIQLSVGYFHISNSNKNGARGLLNKCIPKLIEYRPEYRNIDIENILIGIDKTLDYLEKIEDMKDFNWDLVPVIIKE